MRPQKGHGKVKVCDDIGYAVKEQGSWEDVGSLVPVEGHTSD
ncbi:MAG TPA: hypothetical protein VG122_23915 [Gemmata sp.]|nr:hypothetical protein [Gemmata sp.]